MPKIRIYELAKKLNVDSKDLMQTIKDLKISVVNHMSSLSVEDEATVMKKYGKSTGPAAKPEAARPAPEKRTDTQEKNQESPKNAGQPQGSTQTRPQGQGGQQRPQGQGGQRPQGQGGQRPQGQGGQRPQGQGGQRPQGQSGQRPQGQGGQRPQGQSGQRPQGQGGQRPQGQSGQRPQGQGGQRPQGQSGQRPQGQGGQRPQGQSGQRPQGQGGQRPQGQGGQRSQGQGGQRPYGKNQRPANNQGFKQGQGGKPNQKNQKPAPKPVPKPVEPEEIPVRYIGESVTVKELAELMRKSGAELVKHLMKKDMMVSINHSLDFDTAVAIAEEFQVIIEREPIRDIMQEVFGNEEPDKEADLVERSPIVVVMGHVDHGKTSLLDSIRHSSVTTNEAGGITQHIGAYTVPLGGRKITFLDTPGHEAFTAMRMRGAQITDIAILVVAADDGVMPQTVEAINHAKAAEVEIIVAINKMDKPSANPDRVKQELVEYGLVSEDWGGDTICVPVSAVNKEGIDQLLEMILLVADMKELRANPNKKARGAIVEAELDRGRGPVATVLVQNGTLEVGDPVVAGGVYGKIRAMTDDKGRRVKKAGPSTPVEILGLSEVPAAGDTFYVAANEKQARQVAESIIAQGRENLIKDTPQKVSLDDLFSQIQSGNMKDLNLVVKADVQGSVEAVRQSLEKLSNEEVRIRILHGGVGTITESDVMLASASNAIIIGFNVRLEPAAKVFADEEKVDVRLYRVIYNAIEDITAAMKGMLDPVYEEKILGHAEVRQLFKASGIGTIAGSYVLDGKFVRNAKIRITRGGKVIHDGELDSLKRFKDDVKEVAAGYECGLVFKKYNDIMEGDSIEAYIMVEVPR